MSISVGFREGKAVDIPVTLYNESIKKLSNPTCKVLAIFSKMYNSKKFDKCTYLSKGYKISGFSEKIRNELDNKLYEKENEIE